MEVRNGGSCGASLGGAPVGAGRQARDHLARADERRTSRPAPPDRSSSFAARIHGEIDPKDPHNAIIQDLDLAPRNARGKVEYVATFALAKPVDMAKASRVLLYQVVNRGNGQATASPEGYVSLVSGWQGDVIPTANNQTIVGADRTQQGRIAHHRPRHRALLRCAATARHSAPIRLASLGHARSRIRPPISQQPNATLTWHTRETYAGAAGRGAARSPRATGRSPTASTTPWPGTPDPVAASA